MAATEVELLAQLTALKSQLEKRARRVKLLDQYVGDETCPLPDAIVRARITKTYRMLMGLSDAPFGSLVVGAVTDRLIPTGITSSQNSRAELDALWGDVWQDNRMDGESLLAHNAALTHGRAFAIIWPGRDGKPKIALNSAEQVVVQYAEGSRTERVCAGRFWVDDAGRKYANLYRPDGIYKFIQPRSRLTGLAGGQRGEWERRDVAGETWPLANPWGIVPVVELPVNRKLKPGSYPYARGEFEHCIGLLDRINLLTFLGLVVAFWMGFPLRAVIGDKILRDDDDNPLPPFEAAADAVAQFEDPGTRLATFEAADRKLLSIYSELDQLSSLTATPRYYLPMEGGMSNISAETIWATDGALVAKMPTHKGSLGEGWEETLRVAGLMLPQPVELSPRAELSWSDHEHRSLAERADAASKLKDVMPWQLLAEKVLNLTADEISRGESAMSSTGLGQLVASLTTPTPPGAQPPALALAPPPAPTPAPVAG